jgi:hypothetical protein
LEHDYTIETPHGPVSYHTDECAYCGTERTRYDREHWLRVERDPSLVFVPHSRVYEPLYFCCTEHLQKQLLERELVFRAYDE